MRYGRKLTTDEYTKAIIALHSPSNAALTNKEFRRGEFELNVAFRLGQEYPADKKKALWHALEKVDRKRKRLVLLYLLSKVITIKPETFTNYLAKALIKECKGAVGKQDVKEFLALDDPSAARLLSD